MKIEKTMALMRKYMYCPNCQSDRVGNGKGTLVIEKDYFHRTCECGFDVKIYEDDKIED